MKKTPWSNIEVKLPQKSQKKMVFFSDSDFFTLKTIDLTSTTTQFRYQATVAGRAWAMAVDAIGGSGNADENDIWMF